MSESHPWLIDLAYVVPVYFDQSNTEVLTSLLRHYATYSSDVLDRMQFVIVDDGSPVVVSIPPDIDLNITLLRVRENIAWNQGGARNLGVLYARCDTVLATDVDHEYSEETFRYLMAKGRLGKRILRFRRRNEQGAWTTPAPNLFAFSRGRFMQLFGVDEEFCGRYGAEDGMFWRWQRYNGSRFGYLPRRYANRCRVVDHERGYHTLVRDNTENEVTKKRKRREWAKWGYRGGHSRRFLRFTWDVVEERQRTPTWRPPEDHWWKLNWRWRWLVG